MDKTGDSGNDNLKNRQMLTSLMALASMPEEGIERICTILLNLAMTFKDFLAYPELFATE